MLAFFPPELITLIIKEVRPSRDSLKACALVCRSWCYPSQLFLFSRIVLSSDADCKRWRNNIRESPHIASLVSELCISSSININAQDVQNMVPEFSNVQCLEIDRFSEDWGDDEVEFVRRFRDVRILRLNKTVWTARDRMLEIFQAMPAIMSLMLGGSLASTATQGQGLEGYGTVMNMSTGSVVLQNLAELVLTSIERDDTILEFLTSPALDLSGLRSLELQLGHVPDRQLSGHVMSQLFDAFLERVLSLPKCLVLSLPSIFSTGPFLGQVWRTCLREWIVLLINRA